MPGMKRQILSIAANTARRLNQAPGVAASEIRRSALALPTSVLSRTVPASTGPARHIHNFQIQ